MSRKRWQHCISYNLHLLTIFFYFLQTSKIDEYVLEKKTIEMIQDHEIHTRRKKLLDLEIAEFQESARKRQRILDLKAQEAENRLELSILELKRGRQKDQQNNSFTINESGKLVDVNGFEYEVQQQATNQNNAVQQPPVSEQLLVSPLG